MRVMRIIKLYKRLNLVFIGVKIKILIFISFYLKPRNERSKYNESCLSSDFYN